jgi:hypothetical protein
MITHKVPLLPIPFLAETATDRKRELTVRSFCLTPVPHTTTIFAASALTPVDSRASVQDTLFLRDLACKQEKSQ